MLRINMIILNKKFTESLLARHAWVWGNWEHPVPLTTGRHSVLYLSIPVNLGLQAISEVFLLLLLFSSAAKCHFFCNIIILWTYIYISTRQVLSHICPSHLGLRSQAPVRVTQFCSNRCCYGWGGSWVHRGLKSDNHANSCIVF